MNKEELIGKLQMVYVGDRNALNEMIGYYDGLREVIEELKQENEKLHHYKTLYQSLKKQKEELRNYLTKEISDARSEDNLWLMGVYDEDKNILEKMEELEQPKKELLKPSHYDEDIDVEYELEKARKFIQEDKKRKFGKE